jgi:hypothetical protein
MTASGSAVVSGVAVGAKAARWESEGRLEDSPITWAAFATAYG